MPLSLLLLVLLPISALAEDCELIVAENAEGASITIAADGAKAELEIGDGIGTGESIATGKSAWVDLRLCDGSGLRVGESSKFKFETAAKAEEGFTGWAFELIKGSLLALVEGEEKKETVKMRVRTKFASIGVRGTEFLVETDETEGTNVHTVEGEVLMGAASDFEPLGTLRGEALQGRFEAVAKESMSRIAKGEARPRKAAHFALAEFRQLRQPFFQRRIARVERGEAMKRIGQAREARKLRQENRQQNRQQNKQQRKEERRENRGERKEQRQENRQLRKENRTENRQTRRQTRAAQPARQRQGGGNQRRR